MMRVVKNLTFALALALSACSLTEPDRHTYRGRYTTGFETSAFTACGGDESWWVSFTPGFRSAALDSALLAARDEAAPRDPDPAVSVYVEVTARLSGAGHFGHLGASNHELAVESVTTVAPWTSTACAS